MPKQQFFNLNTAKQDKIMQAAYQEFNQYPYSEASINRIIKEAEISRGSFYLYFVDKDDVFRYLLDCRLASPFKANLDEVMENQQLNVFDFTLQCFTCLCQVAENEKEFLSQVLMNGTVAQISDLFQFDSVFTAYRLKKDSLRFQSAVDQEMLTATLTTLLYRYLLIYCLDDKSFDEVKSLLLKHLLGLKIGFQR